MWKNFIRNPVHKTCVKLLTHCYNISMKFELSAALAGVASVVIYLFGGIDIAMQCLLIAIVIDYISGLIKAYNTKTLDSKIGFKGILKKVGILCIVCLAVLVDRLTGESGAIRTLVIYYFVANEGLSVLENLAIAGLPIPQSIKKALQALKKESK